MTKGQADLAILPSDLDDTLNWPVVAILRQNVIALVVPAAAPAATPKPEECRRQARQGRQRGQEQERQRRQDCESVKGQIRQGREDRKERRQ